MGSWTAASGAAIASAVSGGGISGKRLYSGAGNLKPIPRVTMASPPTVAMSGTQTISGGVLVPFTPNTDTRFIYPIGAAWSLVNSIYWTPGQANPGVDIRYPCSVMIDAYTAACSLQITSASGNYYRVWVAENGGEFELATTWFSTVGAANGSVQYLLLTFSAAGQRRIRIDMTGGDIAGFIVGPTDTIAAVQPRGPLTLFLGDSYMGGAGFGPTGYNGLSSWPWTCAQALGWENMVNAGVGGQKSTDVTSRLPAIMAAAPWDVVVMQYGKNDNSSTSVAAFQAAIAANCAAIKVGRPTCDLIVIGPDFPGAPANRTADATSWVQYQAAAFAGAAPYTSFLLDTISAALLTGPGRVGATTGSGNGDIFIQNDGAHPTQIGADNYGYRMAQKIRALA